MKKLIIALAAATAVVSLNLNAASNWPEPPAEPGKPMTKQEAKDYVAKNGAFQPAKELYRAGEFQLDLFGSANASDLNFDAIGDSDFGGGIRFNYFLTRNLGAGLETRHIERSGEDFANRTGINLYYRFPINRLALYGIAGAGTRYQDHNITWRAWAGGGVEVRMNGSFGVFSEYRFEQKNFDKFGSDGHVFFTGLRISL
jgi:hypothetical protein